MMNRLIVNVLHAGAAVMLAVGVSACNRDASADAGTGSGAGGAQAMAGTGSAAADQGVKYAKVVSVDPVRQTVNDPSRVCHDEVVSHTVPPRDQNQIAGTAIGAVLGGVLGNQIGHGHGRTLTTVGGAVAGGYAGKRIEESRQQGTVTSSVVRRCSTVDNSSSKIIGYDVRYQYNGVVRSVRMDHDPGDRVVVQEGVTAVSDAR